MLQFSFFKIKNEILSKSNKQLKKGDVKPKSKELINFKKNCSLSIFHACGKFLYNNRIDENKKTRKMTYEELT